MCNLYSITTNREAVAKLFKVPLNRAEAFEPLPAIFPGHMAPVVRRASDDERKLSLLSWGFVLPLKDRASRRVTNVRDDKVLTSSFWRDSFVRRRCLVPASSFCEPNDARPAVWHWFALQGIEPRPLFAFAGIWRDWYGPVRKNGPAVDVDVFSFLTTTPNPLVGTINHERMPVLLTEEVEFDAWMNGTPEEAFALVRPYPPERMRIVAKGEKKDEAAEGAASPRVGR